MYCSCKNCSCTATVLLTKVIDDQEEDTMKFTKNTDCLENSEQDFPVEKQNSETKQFIERLIILIICLIILMLGENGEKS